MTDHEHWAELAAGHVLHGLTPEEEAAFVAHLPSCEACQASVDDHELVAAQLGSISYFDGSDESLPAWESMRSAVVGERSPMQNVVDLAARRRRYQVSRRALAVAAAAAVVVGGGIVTWQQTNGRTSCKVSAGCHVVHLDAAKGRSVISLTIRDNQVTVTPTDMPAAPNGKIYVLWQEARNAHPTPISEFNTGTGSAANGELRVAYADTQQFAVSLEQDTIVPPSAPSNTIASGLAG
jgi:anti-sigma-K factor RskA